MGWFATNFITMYFVSILLSIILFIISRNLYLIIPIIISFFSFLLSAYSILTRNKAVDYQIKKQIKEQIEFNKKAIATQLFIEINLMNPSLQINAENYSRNYDLMANNESLDKNLELDGVYLITHKNNKSSYEMIIHKGIYTQSARMIDAPYYYNGEKYSVTVTTIHKEDSTVYIPTTLENPILPSPLYFEHGMYHIYAKDLVNFNKNLAQNLYIFYNKLINAESNRAFLQAYADSKDGNISDLSGRYFDSYMDMRFNVIEASKMVQDLLNDLNIESGEDLKLNPEIKVPTFDWKSRVRPK
jgi:hypothetical protein